MESLYTTGEIAKLCDVSVRTVQYYDTRGILTPSTFSEGGRRLYSEEDLRRMRIICFLRELDLSIDNIKKLFDDKNSENVISMLIEEQERKLLAELTEKQEKAEKISEVKKSLQKMSDVSISSIGAVAHILANKSKLKRLRAVMVVVGIIMDAVEISKLFLWIFGGIWLPFVIGMIPVIGLGIFISVLYFGNVAYICPECHTVFKPRLRESFFARHTPNTRKLTCTNCGHCGFCVEIFGKD